MVSERPQEEMTTTIRRGSITTLEEVICQGWIFSRSWRRLGRVGFQPRALWL